MKPVSFGATATKTNNAWLYISKQLAACMGGTVKVTSKIGEGTKITFQMKAERTKVQHGDGEGGQTDKSDKFMPNDSLES